MPNCGWIAKSRLPSEETERESFYDRRRRDHHRPAALGHYVAVHGLEKQEAQVRSLLALAAGPTTPVLQRLAPGHGPIALRIVFGVVLGVAILVGIFGIFRGRR
jgi:hypothetical protein